MLKKIKQWLRSLHKWEYHNPYDRTCTVCGRHEVQYCSDMSEVFDATSGWWEAHQDGDQTKHQ